VARARPIEGLEADGPYAEAAARIVAVRADELAEHSARVLDVSDIEGVHDMRVATRRLRAALEIFEPCFPGTDFRAVLAEVKTLADALGERRDRDVTIAALEKFSARVSAADRPGISTLVGRLRDEQAAANRALAPHVAPERLTALGERVDSLVGATRE
jgi:CHAD domain-containing protein